MDSEIENLQKLLQDDPSNFQARRKLSVLLADEGFNEEALANLQYLEKYFPEDAELIYNIGIICEKLKKNEEAKCAYQKAIKISPQEDFFYNLGEVLVSLEEWDEAINAFKEVLKTDKNDGNCYFNLGLCYYNKGETALATDNFQKAVQLNPNDLYAHFYLGTIYENSNLTNFAIESFNKVLSISPDYSWAYFNLAAIAYKNGNLDDAKTNLLLTVQYNKQDIEAYKLLAKICLKDNDVESILSILHSRLEEEENGDLFYILSQIYKKIGQEDEYLETLEHAVKNSLTLTYPHMSVKQELMNAKAQYGSSVETPEEMEEYSEASEDADEEEADEEEYEDEDEEEEDFDEDSDIDDELEEEETEETNEDEE